VRGKRSSGLCRLFRTRAIGRVAVQLCLFLLLADLVAPLAWATAQSKSDGFAFCHVLDHGTAPGLDVPADHSHDSMVPHCPLCLVFGSSVWAPPADAPEILRTALLDRGDPPAADIELPRGEPRGLRPSPRGPPASV
jgi:hypothetical protein